VESTIVPPEVARVQVITVFPLFQLLNNTVFADRAKEPAGRDRVAIGGVA
jgi:hypothetical protein